MLSFVRGSRLARSLSLAVCATLAGTLLAATAVRAESDAGQLDAAAAKKAFPAKPPYSPYAGRDYPTRPLFGDTHLHTSYSMDAGAFGARLTPRDAYRFARGEELLSSSGQPVKLSRPLDFLVVADVLAFIANIGATVWRGRRMTTTAMVLFFGLLMAALLYLPGMIPTTNQTEDSYWRWWVVHLWVEGVWELIMGAILSFLLIKLTGVDREVVEKWLYIIVGFTFLSGILGTGHHYYYIGTPRYWLIVGGVFSALEPVAFLGMAIYAIAMARRGASGALCSRSSAPASSGSRTRCRRSTCTPMAPW